MDSEDHEQGSRVGGGRVEIDMRAPFKSVKEAVALFGERVLVGEIYANKLKLEIKGGDSENKSSLPSKIGALKAELEETKQSLEKAKEESNLMAYCIRSLRGELEEARRELHKIKANYKDDHHQKKPLLDLEIEEDIKFVENPKMVEIMVENEDERAGLISTNNKKRNVKFASPPSLARVIVSKDIDQLSNRSPSTKKTKRNKALVPILGWLFAKKKGMMQQSESQVDAFC